MIDIIQLSLLRQPSLPPPGPLPEASSQAHQLSMGYAGTALREDNLMINAVPQPGQTLLSPTDHTLILIDFQSKMGFAAKSIDGVMLRNDAALVANTASIFNVSTIPTIVAENTFLGPMFDEIKSAFPKTNYIDRTTMNCWEDKTRSKFRAGSKQR